MASPASAEQDPIKKLWNVGFSKQPSGAGKGLSHKDAAALLTISWFPAFHDNALQNFETVLHECRKLFPNSITNEQLAARFAGREWRLLVLMGCITTNIFYRSLSQVERAAAESDYSGINWNLKTMTEQTERLSLFLMSVLFECSTNKIPKAVEERGPVIYATLLDDRLVNGFSSKAATTPNVMTYERPIFLKRSLDIGEDMRKFAREQFYDAIVEIGDETWKEMKKANTSVRFFEEFLTRVDHRIASDLADLAPTTDVQNDVIKVVGIFDGHLQQLYNFYADTQQLKAIKEREIELTAKLTKNKDKALETLRTEHAATVSNFTQKLAARAEAEQKAKDRIKELENIVSKPGTSNQANIDELAALKTKLAKLEADAGSYSSIPPELETVLSQALPNTKLRSLQIAILDSIGKELIRMTEATDYVLWNDGKMTVELQTIQMTQKALTQFLNVIPEKEDKILLFKLMYELLRTGRPMAFPTTSIDKGDSVLETLMGAILSPVFEKFARVGVSAKEWASVNPKREKGYEFAKRDELFDSPLGLKEYPSYLIETWRKKKRGTTPQGNPSFGQQFRQLWDRSLKHHKEAVEDEALQELNWNTSGAVAAAPDASTTLSVASAHPAAFSSDLLLRDPGAVSLFLRTAKHRRCAVIALAPQKSYGQAHADTYRVLWTKRIRPGNEACRIYSVTVEARWEPRTTSWTYTLSRLPPPRLHASKSQKQLLRNITMMMTPVPASSDEYVVSGETVLADLQWITDLTTITTATPPPVDKDTKVFVGEQCDGKLNDAVIAIASLTGLAETWFPAMYVAGEDHAFHGDVGTPKQAMTRLSQKAKQKHQNKLELREKTVMFLTYVDDSIKSACMDSAWLMTRTSTPTRLVRDPSKLASKAKKAKSLDDSDTSDEEDAEFEARTRMMARGPSSSLLQAAQSSRFLSKVYTSLDSGALSSEGFVMDETLEEGVHVVYQTYLVRQILNKFRIQVASFPRYFDSFFSLRVGCFPNAVECPQFDKAVNVALDASSSSGPTGVPMRETLLITAGTGGVGAASGMSGATVTTIHTNIDGLVFNVSEKECVGMLTNLNVDYRYIVVPMPTPTGRSMFLVYFTIPPKRADSPHPIMCLPIQGARSAQFLSTPRFTIVPDSKLRILELDDPQVVSQKRSARMHYLETGEDTVLIKPDGGPYRMDNFLCAADSVRISDVFSYRLAFQIALRTKGSSVDSATHHPGSPRYLMQMAYQLGASPRNLREILGTMTGVYAEMQPLTRSDILFARSSYIERAQNYFRSVHLEV